MNSDVKTSRLMFSANQTQITNEIKFLIKPIVILLSTVILLLIVLSLGSKEVKKVNQQVADEEKNRDVFTKKVQVLTKVSQLIPQESRFINFALPHQNSVIYALSQIRLAGVKNSVIATNIRTGGSFESKGLSKINVSFDVDGDQNAIYAFLDTLSTSLPVITIDKVKMSTEGGATHATVTINTYASELPKKIPSLTSAVTDFTADEITLLNNLSGYTQPEFFELQAQEQGEREDPFN
jgi:Tfp pilus assembly protein PilO